MNKSKRAAQDDIDAQWLEVEEEAVEISIYLNRLGFDVTVDGDKMQDQKTGITIKRDWQAGEDGSWACWRGPNLLGLHDAMGAINLVRSAARGC